MSFLLNVKYAKIHPKYDSNDFPGIVNLELGWKISKIIFRLNYGSFTKTQHSRNSTYVCAWLDSCICHVHGALGNLIEVDQAKRRYSNPQNSR